MKNETKQMLPFVAPFGVWILLQTLLPVSAASYAVRTCAAALAGVVCWCFARRAAPANAAAPARRASVGGTVAWGLLIGVAVTVLWIGPEIAPPAFADFYRTWFCWPLGSLPAPATTPSPYDPAVCGWPLTLVKLIGSAFVIAPAEELFFRAFLYRRLQRRDFLSVPLSRFDPSAFAWVVFLFTLEHDRPLAAALAGVLYGLTAIRVSLPAAILAHVTTNLLLALHVIHHADWSFW